MKLPLMKAVQSSQIRNIGYEEKTNTLYIQFLRGGLYAYDPVSKDLYEEFMNSESYGKFFHGNIRSNGAINTTKLA